MSPLYAVSLLLVALNFASALNTAISRLHLTNSIEKNTQTKLTRGNSSISELYLIQPLDHDDADSETYYQRYFSRTSYSPSSGASPDYVFLCTGGEGPGFTDSVLLDSVHCTGDMIELASNLFSSGKDVMLYAIEHRYYGLSLPRGDMTSDNYNDYLSSNNAILDVSTFVELRNSEFTTEPKWVTFGGSYPGMISAWSRLLFPELIWASVSNSSPVQAKLNMNEYNEYVGKVLADVAVGGSQECLNAVVEGHSKIGELLATAEGQDELQKSFNVCPIDGLDNPLSVERNAQLFAGDGVIYVPAQENDPSCTSELCNVGKICDSLLNGGDSSETSMDKLVRVAGLQNSGDCVTTDWGSQISMLQTLAATAGGTRSWLYQTCNEFGFYQTCESESSCPYAKGFHPLNQDLEMCQRVFNIDADTVSSNVESSNEFYGGWEIKGSRILFVNGNVDPWSTLAITDNNPEVPEPTECLPAFWVDKASHHFWTHEVLETDEDKVNEGRERVWKQVTQWLELEDEGGC